MKAIQNFPLLSRNITETDKAMISSSLYDRARTSSENATPCFCIISQAVFLVIIRAKCVFQGIKLESALWR